MGYAIRESTSIGEMKMSEQFEPVIVGFLCNWCSYRAADLAGTARIKYAPNMRTIRVMCSGRVDPQFVLKALREGADGVLIAGCHPGECHYVNGNIKAIRRFVLMKKMLKQLGVEDDRVQLVWASASEGTVLAAKVELDDGTSTGFGTPELERNSPGRRQWAPCQSC